MDYRWDLLMEYAMEILPVAISVSDYFTSTARIAWIEYSGISDNGFSQCNARYDAVVVNCKKEQR